MKPWVIRLHIQNQATRLDLALLEALQKEHALAITRAGLKKHFQEKRIIFNRVAAKPALVLEKGSYEITLHIDPNELNESLSQVASPAAEDFQLPIVFEDEDLLVLYKNSGIPSAPQHSQETQTAVNFVIRKFPSLAEMGAEISAKTGRNPLESTLLHRLDTGTSGLLVFAKTQAEYERLHLAWKKREVKKTYRALVCNSGKLPQDFPYLIDFPMGHDKKSSKRMIAITNPHHLSLIRGKALPATTKILKIREIPQEKEILDFEVQIDTGVMHQIRCHLSHLGFPILGDSIYRGRPSTRLWLHAWRLEIPHRTGHPLLLEAALPEGWGTE
jgi:23S rRNA pseudouridine1911/1915/1917 synthase